MTDEYIANQALECFELCGRRDIMFNEEARLNIGKTLLSLFGQENISEQTLKMLNMAWNNYITRSAYIITNPPKI